MSSGRLKRVAEGGDRVGPEGDGCGWSPVAAVAAERGGPPRSPPGARETCCVCSIMSVSFGMEFYFL